MLREKILKNFTENANCFSWKILFVQFAILLYPIFRIFNLPIFTLPIGIIVSSAEDVEQILELLSPISRPKLNTITSKRSIELSLEEESFEILSYIFFRSPENFSGLEYLFTLTLSQDSRLKKRLPIIFFIGGIPKKAKSMLAGKFDFTTFEKSVTSYQASIWQNEFINFIKNRELSTFVANLIYQQHMGTPFNWLDESFLHLKDFFISFPYFSNSITSIMKNLEKAKYNLKNDFESLTTEDDIPRIFLTFINETAKHLQIIFDVNNVPVKSYDKAYPLYDSDFYYLAGSHINSILQKMSPIAGEYEIKETLAEYNILSRTGLTKPVYGRKVTLHFSDGSIGKHFYFPIPRKFLDHEGELTWAEKILTEVNANENTSSIISNDWNTHGQLPMR